MVNLIKLKENDKSLTEQLLQRQQIDPQLNSDVYATLKTPEIQSGLTPKDFKIIDRQKALQFQKQLDQNVNEVQQFKEG